VTPRFQRSFPGTRCGTWIKNSGSDPSQRPNSRLIYPCHLLGLASGVAYDEGPQRERSMAVKAAISKRAEGTDNTRKARASGRREGDLHNNQRSMRSIDLLTGRVRYANLVMMLLLHDVEPDDEPDLGRIALAGAVVLAGGGRKPRGDIHCR
jgi:hypothetical protein